MDVVEAIKEQIDLVDFIGDRIDLHRAGSVHQSLCPFHHDMATPSFTVWPDRWHCFGCGRVGDVIAFQMEYEQQNFIQAVKTLASLFGIQGDFESTPIDPWIKALRAINKKIYNHFAPPINEDAVSEYKKYQPKRLLEEGWLLNTIEQFDLGYCTDLYDYDLFNRIVIPIRDIDGKLVGLAGRRINDDGRKKYRFTAGMNKGDFLYNLNLALPYIQEKHEVILVEGYKDLWRVWESGYKNVVAAMGALITDSQARLLKRYGRTIISALDNPEIDEAGKSGLERVKEECGLFCNIKEVKYPHGKKDYGECSYEQIKQSIETAREIY